MTGRNFEQYVNKAEEHPTLWPAYFSARDFTDRLLEKADESEFEPIVKKFVDDAYSKLLDVVQAHIVLDLSLNVHGEILRTVDDIVKALLSGEQWAVKKYVLGERYDCEKIRAEVARHIPAELQDKRVADLEEEVKRLREQLKWARI